jgi:hypothetical protein
MIRRIEHHPYACRCVVVIESERDNAGDEIRREGVGVRRKCPDHAHLPDAASLYQAIGEDTRRKKELRALAAEHGYEIDWRDQRFEGRGDDRVLVTVLPGTRGKPEAATKRATIESEASFRFGAGKVRVEIER